MIDRPNRVRIGAVAAVLTLASGGMLSGCGQSRGSYPNSQSVAARVDPAVVDVMSANSSNQTTGAGTGVVLTSSGLVVTNNHVIYGSASVRVLVGATGGVYPATVVGYDQGADIAVLQIQDTSGLAHAALDVSARVHVGEQVIGLGNAGGSRTTPAVATGRVTATGLAITVGDPEIGIPIQLSGVIRTSVPLQPGDSGGPLVSEAGDIIGMDTAGGSTFQARSFSDNPQGYAIAAPAIAAVVSQIEAGHAGAGVHVGPTGTLGAQFQSFAAGATASGTEIAVSAVSPGLPAAEAGLAPGDVITAVAGHAVATGAELDAALAPFGPGDRITVSWQDQDGHSHTATVTLVPGPPE
jgi:S1-C subfamily serine protease